MKIDHRLRNIAFQTGVTGPSYSVSGLKTNSNTKGIGSKHKFDVHGNSRQKSEGFVLLEMPKGGHFKNVWHVKFNNNPTRTSGSR